MAPNNPMKNLTPTEDDLDSQSSSGETLREKATKTLHGPRANPSQLGDPISLKAETSDNIPTDGESGSKAAARDPRTRSGPAYHSARNGHTLREKAAKKLHGPDANPSQLGDPISIKAETSKRDPREGEEIPSRKRTSKL